MTTARPNTRPRARPNGPSPAQLAQQVQERERQTADSLAPQQKQEVVTFDGFRVELEARADEFMALIPPNVDKTKFMAACIVAIKHKPELLLVDRRSLHIACNQAAEDGLLPNGIEGVINIYKEKHQR